MAVFFSALDLGESLFAALTAASNPALSFCASGPTAAVTNTSPMRS
jgi:hypothetical protein